MRRKSSTGGAVAAVLLVWAVLFFGFWGTVGYVVLHFIGKIW